jgi:hypothetical protein
MKKNELYRSGNFLEGDNAFWVVTKGTKYVTLHYYTRIQGCCDESWSWPLDQAEQLVKVLNEYGGEVAKYKIPNLVKHQKSKLIQ